jgi:lipid II:glycine glycyltransferase (peptidoglycan interpeptide bridge formation enzyme)
MEISIINDKKWKQFVEKLNLNTFLHSLGWIDFNRQFDHKTWQMGLFDDAGNLSSVAFTFKIAAKRGTFLFCPHGPQMMNSNIDEYNDWLQHLKKLAKQEKCSFIRFAPILENLDENKALFTHLGFRDAPIHMHAELTTVLDLTPSLPNILMNMRKTTRQMCNKGEKMIESGEISVIEQETVTDELYQVYSSTADRGGFVPFSQVYLQQEYDSFKAKEKCKILVIKHEDRILSWGLWIIAGKRAFYHQGANILDKKIPASYISHYQGIKWAKEQGAISYDFWGVGPKDDPKHPWANISLFKRGFGGEDLGLVHTQDYPISWKYWITWAFETWRAKRRGF